MRRRKAKRSEVLSLIKQAVYLEIFLAGVQEPQRSRLKKLPLAIVDLMQEMGFEPPTVEVSSKEARFRRREWRKNETK